MNNPANILTLPLNKKESKTKPLLSMLRTLNKKKMIKLRAKKLNDGTHSLFLHLRQNNQQEYQFLKLYIHGKSNTKKKDDETLKLALAIREKKELELFQNDFEFQLYNHNSKADFVQYFEAVVMTKVKDDKTIDKSWRNTLKHLKIFTKNKAISLDR